MSNFLATGFLFSERHNAFLFKTNTQFDYPLFFVDRIGTSFNESAIKTNLFNKYFQFLANASMVTRKSMDFVMMLNCAF